MNTLTAITYTFASREHMGRAIRAMNQIRFEIDRINRWKLSFSSRGTRVSVRGTPVGLDEFQRAFSKASQGSGLCYKADFAFI